jgi:CheY-like chemotaxis protein
MKETPIRVLYIEDDSADVELVKAALEHSCEEVKYEIDVTDDADEALNACRRFKPDLVILDYHLPKMSGLEILQIIRKADIPQMPILMLSGSESPRFLEQAKALGANECFGKPIDFATFKKIFRTICQDWFKPLSAAKNLQN